MRTKRRMNIYACGGLGISVVSQLQRKSLDEVNDDNHCEITSIYVDTSDSDVTGNVDKDNLYLIPTQQSDDVSKDGNGKKRSNNVEQIADSIQDVLLKFKPTDVNIVVHSASGGSGSVIGPRIVSELLLRKQVVIVITVGTSGSKIELSNTIDTLKSYDKISQLRQSPVIVSYHENNADTPPAKVDMNIKTVIVTLSTLFSGSNAKLDSTDLYNFVNYQHTTSHKPALCSLEIFSKIIDQLKGKPLISLATLADVNNSSEPNVLVEYQTVGYPQPAMIEMLIKDLPLHFAIIGDKFPDVVNKLKERISSHNEIRNAIKTRSITDATESSTEDGLIL